MKKKEIKLFEEFETKKEISLNDIVNSNCRVIFSKASELTYHVEIIKNVGGLKYFEIIGTGRTLDDAIEDAIDVYVKRPKDGARAWQYKEIDPRKR